MGFIFIFGIYKRKLRTGRRTHGFIKLIFFWAYAVREKCDYISSFVLMQIFSVDSAQSFINEAPGLSFCMENGME